MRSWRLVMGFAGVMLAAVACAQDTKQEPTVTLSAEGVFAVEVAQQISEMTGIQVLLAGPCEAKVYLTLQEASLEEAVKALAQSIEASWLRAYFIETQQPAQPYTGDQVVAALEFQRNAWLQSMSATQREALLEQWQEFRQVQQMLEGNLELEYPGAGESTKRPVTEGSGGQQPGGNQGPLSMPLVDPVRGLINPVRVESLSLSVQDMALPQVLYEVTTHSGFLICAAQDVSGTITLQAQEQPLDETLEKIATAVNAGYRRVYVLSVPRPLTQAEVDQRMEAAFQSYMNDFWNKTPEERTAEVNQWVDRINQIAERANQPGQDGQVNRLGQMFQRFAPRILARLGEYSAGLSPDRRMEIKPLITALGNALNR